MTRKVILSAVLMLGFRDGLAAQGTDGSGGATTNPLAKLEYPIAGTADCAILLCLPYGFLPGGYCTAKALPKMIERTPPILSNRLSLTRRAALSLRQWQSK